MNDKFTPIDNPPTMLRMDLLFSEADGKTIISGIQTPEDEFKTIVHEQAGFTSGWWISSEQFDQIAKNSAKWELFQKSLEATCNEVEIDDGTT